MPALSEQPGPADVAPPEPSLVVFSGGTAFNSVAGHMRQLTTRIAHVLPVSDDGGSTAEIVRVLGGPAVGDIRSRCLRLAGASLQRGPTRACPSWWPAWLRMRPREGPKSLGCGLPTSRATRGCRWEQASILAMATPTQPSLGAAHAATLCPGVLLAHVG